MPGNCSTEAQCFRNSTDWFWEEPKPRLLKDSWKLDHACVLVVTPLVSIMKDQVEKLIRLGLRAFTIDV